MKFTKLFENVHTEDHLDYQKKYPLEKEMKFSVDDGMGYIDNNVTLMDLATADAEHDGETWTDHTFSATGSCIQDAVDNFIEEYSHFYEVDYGKGHLRNVLNKLARETGPCVVVKKIKSGYEMHDNYTGMSATGKDRKDVTANFIEKTQSKYPKGHASDYANVAMRQIRE